MITNEFIPCLYNPWSWTTTSSSTCASRRSLSTHDHFSQVDSGSKESKVAFEHASLQTARPSKWVCTMIWSRVLQRFYNEIVPWFIMNLNYDLIICLCHEFMMILYRDGWSTKLTESQLTHPPGHFWRDNKWTALSGPLSSWSTCASRRSAHNPFINRQLAFMQLTFEGLAWCKSGHVTIKKRGNEPLVMLCVWKCTLDHKPTRSCAERQGNTWKGWKDFGLQMPQDKARIWPWLSLTCHILSTAVILYHFVNPRRTPHMTTSPKTILVQTSKISFKSVFAAL